MLLYQINSGERLLVISDIYRQNDRMSWIFLNDGGGWDGAGCRRRGTGLGLWSQDWMVMPGVSLDYSINYCE